MWLDAQGEPKFPSQYIRLCPRLTATTALMLAHKMIRDHCYRNGAWSNISGIPLARLNACERAMGNVMDWTLCCGFGLDLSATKLDCNVDSSIDMQSHYVLHCCDGGALPCLLKHLHHRSPVF